MSDFSKNLEELRIEHDLNYEEFADKLGTNRTTIWRYIKDMRRPDIDFAVNVAQVFKVNLDWLLGDPLVLNAKKYGECNASVDDWTDDELLEIELYKKLLLEKRKLKKQ